MPASLDHGEQLSDEKFLLDLYRRYRAVMYSTVSHIVIDKREVDDILQDCMVKLIAKLTTLRELNAFQQAAYMVATAKNTALNYNRRKEREDNRICFTEMTGEDVPDDAPTAEQAMLAAVDIEEFWQLFHQLSDTEQMLLMGKYFLEMSDAQLSELLGCKPESVRMKLTRARRKALELMKRGGLSL